MLQAAPYKDQYVESYDHCGGMQEWCTLVQSSSQSTVNDNAVLKHNMTPYARGALPKDKLNVWKFSWSSIAWRNGVTLIKDLHKPRTSFKVEIVFQTISRDYGIYHSTPDPS